MLRDSNFRKAGELLMITQPHLILASASPRRTELLQQIGIPHEVVPANVVEEAPYPMSPHEYVRHLSQKKARAITADGVIPVSYTHLTLPTNREV